MSFFVKAILILFLLVVVHVVLYLSKTEEKINYKLGSTSGYLYLRKSKNLSSVGYLEDPDVSHILNEHLDSEEVETFRKCKNLSTLMRSKKFDVLQNLEEHVNADNVEKFRKTLASMEMTSEMFFHPTKINKKLQLGQIPIQDSCAVIGSSGILKGSSCGREIEAHDFVIRENMAPVKGFEADVGTRTSLMTSNDEKTRDLIYCLTNSESPCHKKYTEVLKGFGKMYFGIPVYRNRPKSDQKEYDNFFSIAKFVNSEIDFRIPLHKFRYELTRYWKLPKIASGGFVNVNIAFTFCKRISLYGFFPFSQDLSGRKLKYHYYDNRSVKSGLGVHSMPLEYKLYRELHKNHTLRHVITPCS
ncbi:alpha-2,8-sialyltransferase 8B-like isoform X2 [Anneissia japonica]|nr:alpha-2,8-sialyltransferase 8B-like isoform X2 [Anneissia japonica]XP_033106758.1 alpha-2,8-sialyltransferase 8B-like isoform X2 [Anneissia japonica]